MTMARLRLTAIPRQSGPAPKADPIDPAESEQTREVLIHAMGLAEG